MRYFLVYFFLLLFNSFFGQYLIAKQMMKLIYVNNVNG